ncbi:MAG: CBS domain-containing protein, partial [Anaerolineales bacterium]|nr:CBS domain-containing protein [Anaerolineales bacterium]
MEVLRAITVGEVMNQDADRVLYETETVAEAMNKLSRWRHHGLPVVNKARDLVGILTIQDVERTNRHVAQQKESSDKLVGDICTRQLLVAYPEESLGTALRRMSVRDVGRLPVVARDNSRRLLGVLRRNDVIRAYDTALTRRAALRHRAHQVRLGVYSGVHIEEVTVEAGAACEAHQIYEMTWPHECVIASVRRGSQVIIPHGNTVLQTGDILVVVADGES